MFEVMVIEFCVYFVFWLVGNFIDLLVVGYLVYVLCDEDIGELVGYFFVMKGVEEMYLLNIIVVLEW